ncbi:MAG: YkgJ family cysteine cluster protein [Byssovorax sp.]
MNRLKTKTRSLPLAARSRWTPEVLLGVAEGERRALGPVLAFDDDGAAIEAARLALERTLSLGRAAVAREPPSRPIECARGCSYCCSSKVVITAPEALRIAAHLRRTLDPEAFAAVLARVVAVDERTRGLSRARRFEARIACPLLEGDGSCSVHEVRPITCAGWTSLDVAACERHFGAEIEQKSAPVYALGYEIAGAILAGLSQACTDLGLDGALLELTAAVRIALERPTAGERWRRRLPVFARARDAESTMPISER